MLKRTFIFILCILTAVLMTFGSNSVGAEKTITLRMGSDLALHHPELKGGLRFGELVNKKTNGEVKIEIFPSSQLGDLRELMELIQVGTVDFCMNTSGVAGSFVPDMILFNLPFLFNDKFQQEIFYEGPLGKKILESCEEKRIKGLAFHTLLFRAPMNNKRPIKALDDFKGLKIRLMQVPIHIDTYKALGASPVAIPLSELYTAAQMGTVDGFENAAVTLYHEKLFEVGKYYSTLPVFAYTNLILASMKTWKEKLSDSQRKAILDSLPESVAMINKGSDDAEEEGLRKFRESGVQVYTGPFDLKPFRKAVQPVYDKWVPKLSKEAQEVVKELQKQWK